MNFFSKIEIIYAETSNMCCISMKRITTPLKVTVRVYVKVIVRIYVKKLRAGKELIKN